MNAHGRLWAVIALLQAHQKNQAIRRISSESTPQSTMANSSIPRWQTSIENALEVDSKSNVYQLATCSTVAYPLATASPIPQTNVVVPRVRSVIHRAFLSPVSPSSPLLLTTTDIRTPKARQMAQNPTVEIAWWFAPTQEQFRISGRAYILPAPAPDFAGNTDYRPLETMSIESRAQMLAKTFPRAELGGVGFDWEAKRVELFDSMSGHMKASWVRPVPGTPMEGGYGASKAWPESLPKLGEASGEEEKKLLQDALRNFALVVIYPAEVDFVELGVVPNRRTHFMRKEGGWEEMAVVP